MRKFIFYAVLILFSVSIMFSCNEDDDNIVVVDIYGSWTVLQTDAQGQSYNVELRINTNNSYDWILLDTVQGHTNSYAEFDLEGNLMIITDDADCDCVGEYYLIRKADKLAIIARADDCAPRIAALEYVWKKKIQ